MLRLSASLTMRPHVATKLYTLLNTALTVARRREPENEDIAMFAAIIDAITEVRGVALDVYEVPPYVRRQNFDAYATTRTSSSPGTPKAPQLADRSGFAESAEAHSSATTPSTSTSLNDTRDNEDEYAYNDIPHGKCPRSGVFTTNK